MRAGGNSRPARAGRRRECDLSGGRALPPALSRSGLGFLRGDREIGVLRNVEPPTRPGLECLRGTGLILRCDRKVGNPFQTKQGRRPSCPDQEGRKGSEEGVPETLGVPLEGYWDFGELCGSHQWCQVPFRPFPNSSGWWWLISSVFRIRISCHKTTHANGYYGAWPGWAVSISVLPLTQPFVT